MKTVEVRIFRPSGNDTALVEGIPMAKDEKKRINDLIMQKCKNVEQVGFYSVIEKRLEMAGGEFCGNATRAFVYLLNQRTGKKRFKLTVSGAMRPLIGGINDKNEVYAEMPVKKSFESVFMLAKDKILVDIEGIRIILDFDLDNFLLVEEELKTKSKEMIVKLGYDTKFPACGVMYVQKIDANIFKLRPVVWVRDIQTLFYETACGSGTTAFGVYRAYLSKGNYVKSKIIQPTGMTINSCVKKDKAGFTYAEISGEVEMLSKEDLIIEDNSYGKLQ